MPMSEENRTEWIALYLQGSLDEKDLAQFNERLATDQKFKREVEVQRAIVRNITSAGRRELKHELRQFHRQIIHETGMPASETEGLRSPAEGQSGRSLRVAGKKRMRWLVAAGITAALMATGWGYYAYLSAARLYNAQFEPYVMRTARGTEPYGDILSFYRAHDYDQYLSHYQARLAPSLQETFLAGNAYLVKDQPAQAIESFRQVIDQNKKLPAEEQRYDADAEYFLALAFLKNNEPDQARLLFRKIAASPQHAYHHDVGAALLLKLRLVQLKER